MKGHILIVDDEPAIRFFLSETLSQAGYEVTTAASGEQALALLQQQPIDLVLLDLKMEGIDGLQVMAEVERLPLPPVVIILTAHASLDSAIQAMRRGGPRLPDQTLPHRRIAGQRGERPGPPTETFAATGPPAPD
jgi:CheY-like chemotaxis protein